MSDKPNITAVQSHLADSLTVFSRTQSNPKKSKKMTRVAAYCRVSTDLECQQSSIDVQITGFQTEILQHEGWKLAGIYTDKGISGTSVKFRSSFMKMMKDARAGKIDYIITKSVSRFARNTVDVLKYTRLLKSYGVFVYFEEQKIDTASAASEMILTVQAAFAQEESHSISENLKQGKRKRFEMGIPQWYAIYGYRKGQGDNAWVIEEKEAAVIQSIFEMYLQGKTFPQICKILNDGKIPTTRGNKWTPTLISALIHNEKYTGDIVMQKYYSPDFMKHSIVRNSAEILPRYFLKNHHPAIVDRESFLFAQKIALMRDNHRGCQQYPYYGTLRCPYCGKLMISAALNCNRKGRAWTCGGEGINTHRHSDRTSCPPYMIKQKYIDCGVMRAFTAATGKTNDSIEYAFLCRNVDSITFYVHDGIVDWNTIVVQWKQYAMSFGSINYEMPSERPVVKPEFKNGIFYADGKTVTRNGGTARIVYESVLNLQRICNELLIFDNPEQPLCDWLPEYGTTDLPVVLTEDTIKELGENENE